MEGSVPSEISSASVTGAVNEPATEGGEDIVPGTLLTLLGGSNKQCWGVGREHKQSDVVW